MSNFYLLTEEHETVPAALEEWLKGGGPGTPVRRETLPNGLFVSTVFLGIDHRLIGDGQPLLFETMVFPRHGNSHDLDCARCSTWDEAETQHAAMVARWSGAALRISDEDED